MKLERRTFGPKEFNDNLVRGEVNVELTTKLTEIIVTEFRELSTEDMGSNNPEPVYVISGDTMTTNIKPVDESDRFSYAVITTANTVELICLFDGNKYMCMSSEDEFLLIGPTTEIPYEEECNAGSVVDWMMHIKDIIMDQLSYKTLKALASVKGSE